MTRFSASAPGRMSFVARMDSLLRYRTLVEEGTYIMRGKAPRHAEPNCENVVPQSFMRTKIPGRA